MEVVNNLAYLDTVYITAVKRLMLLAPGYANFNGIFWTKSVLLSRNLFFQFERNNKEQKNGDASTNKSLACPKKSVANYIK